MKRNCLNTNEPFKRGHVRDDGFVFFAYTKVIKADGFFKEIWLSPAASEKIKAKDRQNKKAKYQRKSQRHSPGFATLPLNVRSVVNQVHRIHEDQLQYNDMPLEEIAEQLAEHMLTSEQWDVVVQHSGPVCFNLKEAIRIAVSM